MLERVAVHILEMRSENVAIERFKLVSAVHLFFIRDGKILLLRRFNTGYEDGKYG
jgi:hypothetical protein